MEYINMMISGQFKIPVYIMIFMVCFPVWLSSQEIPYQLDSRYTELSEIPEPLTADQLTNLFLIASGTDEARIPFYTAQIDEMIVELKDYLRSTDRGAERDQIGEFILRFMHEKLLTRYSLTQTKLDVLLDSGRYNCVSSAVLYMILTRSVNLFTSGIQTKDHAFCVVESIDGGDEIDVETTNIWGYNPGVKKEFHSEFTNQTGFAYVPPGEYANRIRQGDKDMAGLILQNRIVEYQRKKQYEEALAQAANRLALTRSDQAKRDYFDSVQNLAAWHNNLKQYDEGILVIQTLAEGPYELPDFLLQTRYQMVYNLCGNALNNGDTVQAETILTQYNSFLPENLLQELTFLIEEKKLDAIMKKGYSEDTVTQILDSLERGLITSKRAEEMLIYLYAKEAERLSFANDYLKGLLFLQDVDSWVRDSRDFERLLSVYEQNYAIEVHNSVLPHINNGRIVEARALIDDGLRYIPDNRLLQDDLKKIDSMQ